MNHTFVSLVPNSDDEEYQNNKTRMNEAPGTRAKRECARKNKESFWGERRSLRLVGCVNPRAKVSIIQGREELDARLGISQKEVMAKLKNSMKMNLVSYCK